jgi:hypothetical protein
MCRTKKTSKKEAVVEKPRRNFLERSNKAAEAGKRMKFKLRNPSFWRKQIMRVQGLSLADRVLLLLQLCEDRRSCAEKTMELLISLGAGGLAKIIYPENLKKQVKS